MLVSATQLCQAKFGTLFRYDGEMMHRLVGVGTPKSLTEFQRKRGPFVPPPGMNMSQALRTRQPMMSMDEAAVPEPGVAAKYGGARSTLYVPLLQEKQVVGMLVIYRQEVRPFTDKQIELVQNFAAQAVIAIENTRLLNELRQRTDDLTESLEQQTATSEVLSVISSSPGNLDLVFQAMLEKATRVCEAKFGVLFRPEMGAIVPAASYQIPQAFSSFIRSGQYRPTDNGPIQRAARNQQIVHVVDFATERGYIDRDPMMVAGVELGGIRSLLIVPMLKDNELVGIFAIFRQEVRPFTDKQIELITTFAAQAVIAIENTRLLNELRAALEQQTATSEVLKVISSSPGELEPVFRAMLASAVHICDAKFGNFLLREGANFRGVAVHGEPDYVESWRQEPLFVIDNPEAPLARATTTKAFVHIPDLSVCPGTI